MFLIFYDILLNLPFILYSKKKISILVEEEPLTSLWPQMRYIYLICAFDAFYLSSENFLVA